MQLSYRQNLQQIELRLIDMFTGLLPTNEKAALRLLCDPAGARTQDPILKRDVLYQLSY
jgi:hypothetical protein